MKNNLTDSIYKAWRTGILPLVTALLLLTGCEMDSDMDLPLNVDSNKYTLTSDAGSTQVRIDPMNIYYEKIESCKIVLCSVILKPEIHRRDGNGVLM